MEVPVYSVLTPTTVADVITAGGLVSYVLVDGEAVLEADALTATRTAVSLTANNVTDGTAGAEIQLSYSAVDASRAPKVYWFATDDVSDPSVLAIAETAVGSEFQVRGCIAKPSRHPWTTRKRLCLAVCCNCLQLGRHWVVLWAALGSLHTR